jgi:hypothetical protein
VLIVVSGQRLFGWREIIDVWIRRMRRHDDYFQKLSASQVEPIRIREQYNSQAWLLSEPRRKLLANESDYFKIQRNEPWRNNLQPRRLEMRSRTFFGDHFWKLRQAT